jgi:hypothetical protein
MRMKTVVSTCAAPKSKRALAWRFATSSNVERCLDSARHDKKLEWRRHGHKENRDHYKCDHQFADHSAEISQ